MYEKHIKPLKPHIQVPIINSILGKVGVVLASVQTRILANIQKTKSPTFDMLRRSIDYLLILECLPEPVDFCLTYIHSLLNTRLARSFEKAKTAVVPWLLPSHMQVQSLRDLMPVGNEGQSVEKLILKVVAKATSLLRIFKQLLSHYYTPAQMKSKQTKVQSMLEETASLLCSSLQDCISHSPDIDTKALCRDMSLLAQDLAHTQFDAFFERFLQGHVERHFRDMEKALGEFHLREMWAMDLENPAGTALPRLCYCHCFESMSSLHSQLPLSSSSHSLSSIHQYLQSSLQSFISSMLRATTETNSRLSANQRLLRVASNLQYFQDKVVESLYEAANGLFGSGEELGNCRPMVEHIQGVCEEEIRRLQEEFVLRKVGKLKKILMEGIAVTGTVGVKVSDEAMFGTAYMRKLYNAGKYAFEPRPYLIELLICVCKAASKLPQRAPGLHIPLLSSLISQVLKSWLTLIDSFETLIDPILATFLSTEANFYIEITKNYSKNEKRIADLVRKLENLKGKTKKQELVTMKSSFDTLKTRYKVLFQPVLVA